MPRPQRVRIFIILAHNKHQDYFKGQKKMGTSYYTEASFLYYNHLPFFMKAIILRCISNKKFHSGSKEY